MIIFRINVEINNITIVFSVFYCQFLYFIPFLVLTFSTKMQLRIRLRGMPYIKCQSIKWVITISQTSKATRDQDLDFFDMVHTSF